MTEPNNCNESIWESPPQWQALQSAAAQILGSNGDRGMGRGGRENILFNLFLCCSSISLEWRTTIRKMQHTCTMAKQQLESKKYISWVAIVKGQERGLYPIQKS